MTDTAAEDARLRVPLEVEPKLLALGPTHIMAAINDRAWFYRLRVTADGTAGPPVAKREYLSEVREAALGPSHCVALCGGTVLAHAIEPSSGGDAAADAPHPLNEGDSPATCVTAVGELVLWGTEDGSVHFWHSPVSQPPVPRAARCSLAPSAQPERLALQGFARRAVHAAVARAGSPPASACRTAPSSSARLVEPHRLSRSRRLGGGSTEPASFTLRPVAAQRRGERAVPAPCAASTPTRRAPASSSSTRRTAAGYSTQSTT